MSKRIHFNRFEGTPLPENTVLITKPSRWGNPFKIPPYSRKESLRLYLIYLQECLDNGTLNLSEITGKDLACNCELTEQCHGDILLEFLNRE